jgi:hypothetical protein
MNFCASQRSRVLGPALELVVLDPSGPLGSGIPRGSSECPAMASLLK